MSDIKFYDTSSLLIAGESIFEKGEPFVISSITLKELENIKTSNNKDVETKYSARLLLRLLEENKDIYEVYVHTILEEAKIAQKAFSINDDLRILSDAIAYDAKRRPDETIFVTNDLCLAEIANLYFGKDCIEKIEEDKDYYTGYLEVWPTEEELANFYQKLNYNHYNLLKGQYLIIFDKDNKAIDKRVWDGDTYCPLSFESFKSDWFGTVRPYSGDPYQQLLCDSFMNNRITLVKGPAGTGKTLLSFAYLMSAMDKGIIDKIVVFCNTVATANSAKLGFYPGTRDEKLLDSQIGNLLSSKFGGRDGVEKLIEDNKLILLPLSDIRGYDTSGMNAGVYISEAQNLDRTLIKLALQRIGEDCICIIDGDEKTQVDDIHFSGNNNGIKRVSKVFRGQDIYCEVTLKNIYRSKISKIAENI